jgi:aspartyl-tRNA(Asn)/glutamyl-tRNA(Gln) amidotransferase subunit B
MLWDPEQNETRPMRSKEEAQDYRYFPEPDLPPFRITAELLAPLKAGLGERPLARRRRFQEALGLDEYSARVLTAEKALADFFEALLAERIETREAANWVREECLRACNEQQCGLEGLHLAPAALAALIRLVTAGTINRNVAREQVFPELVRTGRPAAEIVREKNLTQVSDTATIDEAIRRALAAKPQAVADYRKGKKAAAQAIFGQAMREAGGKANPQVVRERLERLLAGPDGPGRGADARLEP